VMNDASFRKFKIRAERATRLGREPGGRAFIGN
jgi:hypothetical protein